MQEPCFSHTSPRWLPTLPGRQLRPYEVLSTGAAPAWTLSQGRPRAARGTRPAQVSPGKARGPEPHSPTPQAEGGLRDTYEDLVDVPPDVRHDLGAITARQRCVEAVLLDGLQEPGRVPKAQHPPPTPGQGLHQVVHGDIGGCAAQDLWKRGGGFRVRQASSVYTEADRKPYRQGAVWTTGGARCTPAAAGVGGSLQDTRRREPSQHRHSQTSGLASLLISRAPETLRDQLTAEGRTQCPE